MKRLYLLLLLCTMTVVALPAASDWSDCPSACRCVWVYGKKSVLCPDAGFTTVPSVLHAETQVLNLSGNAIPYLAKDAFISVGLLNLQKIFLKAAGVREVHRDAFKDLKILVEVDLSDNAISTLHRDTFTGNERLRVLCLSGNPISELRPAQFPPLPHLKHLELHNCRLASVHRDALRHVTNLEYLNLSGNRLETISETVFRNTSNLKTLHLYSNRWRCDCHLASFRTWLLASKLYSRSLQCWEPTELLGKNWEEVNVVEFACAPWVSVEEKREQKEIGGNVTFHCEVLGDPEPTVRWLQNGKDAANLSESHEQVLLLEQESIDQEDQDQTKKRTSLTVLNISESHAGEYTCVAVNLRGSANDSGSLILPEKADGITYSRTESWYFHIVCAVVSVVSVLVVAASTCCYCHLRRRGESRRHRRKAKLMSSMSFNDQEKKLLDVSIATSTDRQTGSLDGISSHADMEMLEQSMQSIPLEPPVHITIESHPPTDPNAALVYPPPPEFSTSILPAGAFGNIFISVSVNQEPHSPCPSDITKYPDLLDINPSKSTVSVGTGPNTPLTQFYTTLPRRPRLKPGPPPPGILRSGHPRLTYDNMGPRVTADGSSTLSLPDSASQEDLSSSIPTPPPPPPSLPPTLCSSMTVEYVAL
nr:PREDICTED: leucine-rich repeats and immunoglobulin-like domains protein 1 [Bemisia tabaci]